MAECVKIVYARQLCTNHYQKARLAKTLPPSNAQNRPCAQCGELMTGRTSDRAKFCGYDCKETYHAAARQAKIVASKVGRTCAQCSKPIRSDVTGKAKTCSRECGVAYQNAVRAAAKRARWEAEKKPCAQCGGEIPAERHAGSKYCSPECKKKTMDARWRERSPGYMRQYFYGVTPERYAEMLAEQGSRCAICRTDTPGGKGGWHVDHCHDSKKVRGLLCHHCNIALGNFKDNIVSLRAAIDYLMAAESLPEAALTLR